MKEDILFLQTPFTTRGVFATLPKLRKLSLNDNQFRVISGQVFCGPLKLKFLSLANNCFTRLPNHVFMGCAHLSKLQVSHSLIGFVFEHTFSGVSRLTKLDLSHNQLLSVYLGVLPKGCEVNLDHNPLDIEDIHGFEEVPVHTYHYQQASGVCISSSLPIQLIACLSDERID